MECVKSSNCKNFNKKCFLCTDYFHYVEIKQKKTGIGKPTAKQDKRQGSSFEYNNQKNNEQLVSARLTPNSGAGKIKGDAEIAGIINIMEELKTRVKEMAPGKESFTIKKQWLEKLNREAIEANKEFWYLKFSFNEFSEDVYIIVEQETIMSMVATMIDDRKEAISLKIDKDISEKEKRILELENVKLKEEIALLKLKLEKESRKNGHSYKKFDKK